VMVYVGIGIAVLFLLTLLPRIFGGDAGTIFDKDDPRLLEAKQKARDSLPLFWAALEARAPADEMFVLKFNLNHGLGLEDNESIWAGNIVRREGRIFGELGNEPVNPAFRIDQEVEIAPEAIDDWSFFRNGVAQGNFVTRLMIETAPVATASRLRRELGWE
jgi:uncharacterized protein YegJ (DUF2314 family)